MLTDIAPCLVLLILPAWDWVWSRRLSRIAFGLALAISVFIQATGAFCYPRSEWDVTPVSIGERPGRLWDWRDTAIARSLSAGPRVGPSAEAISRLRKAF
ncbi:MAG TPA: hypothetical protein VLH09_03385 [Bryobacteraceae bacterium]|nr:hypothetical protein [Bryobacteraceae bacterium]